MERLKRAGNKPPLLALLVKPKVSDLPPGLANCSQSSAQTREIALRISYVGEAPNERQGSAAHPSLG